MEPDQSISSTGPNTAVSQQTDRKSLSSQTDKSIEGQGSIMQVHSVGRGEGIRGHRERDRLKFLEGRKKVPTDSEPRVLSVEEVRKQREAYFMSRAQKDGQKHTPQPVEQKSENGRSFVGLNHKQREERTAHWENGKKMASERQKQRTEEGNKVRVKVNDTSQLQRCTVRKDSTRDQVKPKNLETDDKQQTLTASQTQRRIQRALEKGIPRVKNTKAEYSQPPSSTGRSDQPSLLGYDDKVSDTAPLPESVVHQEQLKGGCSKGMDCSAVHSQLYIAFSEPPCFICEELADATFVPCGHVVVCKQCATRARRCPICKVSL